jgi:hypothetical protein
MKTLLLYSTPGCHLCELAKDILLPLLEPHQAQLFEVDIAEDDLLIERFGVRIPVLSVDASEVEQGGGVAGSSDDLGWPFDSALADAYLNRVLSDI